MNVPTIGGTKGIFETFLPGVFLLLNLGVAASMFPFSDDETKRLISDIGSNPALLLAIVVAFGYLIGVLLRLLRTVSVDRLSAAWLRESHRQARRDDGKYKLWATEDFPYIGLIGERCERLPPKALDFYNEIWEGRKRDNDQNRAFFNFCKIIIYSKDERAAREIQADEALCRYIAGIFYALTFSFIMLFDVLILRFLASGQIVVGLIIILCSYLCALIVILERFRFMRIKEAETVFFASFRNRSLFEEKAATADEKRILKIALD
jgi:hypothetical protein